ncbi:MAG: DUF551 domain-containing protein [Lachnospiraceae bacterium]|nr:DUF551 domain-containing protein [Lachnospiraceae bacterium]
MTKLEKVLKELRWLQFNFPWQDNPENDADKMFNAIHKYTGDAIELLESQQWVSVENRPPEHGVTVFVAFDADFGLGRKEKVVDTAMLQSCGFVGGGYRNYLGPMGFCETKVTHWMPCPEPPKEGDSE